MNRFQAFLRGLRDHDWPDPAPPPAAGGLHLAFRVQPGWIDYNGHMTESRYLFAASLTSDAVLRLIGADAEYVASGFSYYTVETHIRHLGEARLGDALTGAAQILAADAKRLHLFITIARDGTVLATVEQMLLHVDMAAGKACPASAAILARLEPLASEQSALPHPAGVGRHIGALRR